MQYSKMFPELIENTLELVCEFNELYSDNCYKHYLPLKVLVHRGPDAVLTCGSEAVQASRIAGAIYEYLETERDYLEERGWPSARIAVDGWAVLLVAPEDQCIGAEVL